MRYFQFRRGLKKVARRNPEHAAIIQQTLDNEDLCAEACAFCEEKFAEEPRGRWQDFLAWILENQESIVAFIKSIIDLFMQPEEPASGGCPAVVSAIIAAVCLLFASAAYADGPTSPSELAAPTAASALAAAPKCVCQVVNGVCNCKAGECNDPLCQSNIVAKQTKAKLGAKRTAAGRWQWVAGSCTATGCSAGHWAWVSGTGKPAAAATRQPANYQQRRTYSGPVRTFINRFRR